jgi:hypothetical protein
VHGHEQVRQGSSEECHLDREGTHLEVLGLLVMAAYLAFALMLLLGVVVLIGAAAGFAKGEGHPVWRGICLALLVIGGLMTAVGLGFFLHW